MKAKRAAIADVAREAMVSTTTVSRVINKIPTVRTPNRLRVEAAIRKLNYRPDVSAQRLAGTKSNTIGLLIPHFEGLFSSYYASELIRGVGAGAVVLGFDILLHITRGTAEEIHSFRSHILNPKYVAGIVVADVGSNWEYLKTIEAERIPHLFMNYFVEEGKTNCVAVDNEAAAVGVAKYLAGLGHRHIGTITGDLKVQCAWQRLEGFKKGLETKGINLDPKYITFGDFGRSRARECMEELLALDPPPTAVFVASDEMALEAIDVINKYGLRVPDDISVIGFDDNPIATLGGHIRLTTVQQPLAEMGRMSIGLLGQIVRGEKTPPVKEWLDAKLVERDSCQSLKKKAR